LIIHIEQAQTTDAREILELQKLAYQSEAKHHIDRPWEKQNETLSSNI